MLIKTLLVLKPYALLISICYTVLLVIASFISLDDIPEIDVDQGDKVFHLLVYFILVILWYVAIFVKVNWNKSKKIFIIELFSVVFGIIIEFLQGNLTSYRATDSLDILANTIGVLLASIVLWLSNKNVKNK